MMQYHGQPLPWAYMSPAMLHAPWPPSYGQPLLPAKTPSPKKPVALPPAPATNVPPPAKWVPTTDDAVLRAATSICYEASPSPVNPLHSIVVNKVSVAQYSTEWYSPPGEQDEGASDSWRGASPPWAAPFAEALVRAGYPDAKLGRGETLLLHGVRAEFSDALHSNGILAQNLTQALFGRGLFMTDECHKADRHGVGSDMGQHTMTVLKVKLGTVLWSLNGATGWPTLNMCLERAYQTAGTPDPDAVVVWNFRPGVYVGSDTWELTSPYTVLAIPPAPRMDTQAKLYNHNEVFPKSWKNPKGNRATLTHLPRKYIEYLVPKPELENRVRFVATLTTEHKFSESPIPVAEREQRRARLRQHLQELCPVAQNLAVASINVLDFQAGTKFSASLVQIYNQGHIAPADVLCLQECEEARKLDLNHGSYAYDVMYDDKSLGHGGKVRLAGFVRRDSPWKVEGKPEVIFAQEGVCLTMRAVVIVTLKRADAKIRIANTHLCGGRFDEAAMVQKEDTIMQAKTNLLSKAVKAKADVIAGDFNSDFSNSDAHLEYLQRKGFTSTLARLWNEAPRTFLEKHGYALVHPGRLPGEPLLERDEFHPTSMFGGVPDAIWYSPTTVKVVDQWLLHFTQTFAPGQAPTHEIVLAQEQHKGASDHNGIQATFCITPSPAGPSPRPQYDRVRVLPVPNHTLTGERNQTPGDSP